MVGLSNCQCNDVVRQMITDSDWRLEELSIEISNMCIVRCIHCSSGSQPKPMSDELTFDEHKRVMAEARELGATVLSLSGGDPILVHRLPDYIKYAHEVGFSRILLYTTGIWFVDLLYVDGISNSSIQPLYMGWELDKFGLAGIQTYLRLHELLKFKDSGLIFIFSLHSYDASTNDYIMKMPGAFRVITQGIRSLVDAGVTVWTHCVPMQPNIDHISETRDLCVELGVERMSLLRFVPQTRGFANRNVLLPDVMIFDKLQHIIDYELTDPHRRDLPTAIRAGCPADFRHASVGSSIYAAGTGKPKSCHAGVDLILVRPNGVVHPCAAWKTLPTDSNVRQSSLRDIWEGDATYNAIRHYLRDGYKQLEGACGRCSMLHSCRGGCPAQRLHAFGRRLEDLYWPEADPLCPSRLYRPDNHYDSRK